MSTKPPTPAFARPELSPEMCRILEAHVRWQSDESVRTGTREKAATRRLLAVLARLADGFCLDLITLVLAAGATKREAMQAHGSPKHERRHQCPVVRSGGAASRFDTFGLPCPDPECPFGEGVPLVWRVAHVSLPADIWSAPLLPVPSSVHYTLFRRQWWAIHGRKGRIIRSWVEWERQGAG